MLEVSNQIVYILFLDLSVYLFSILDTTPEATESAQSTGK